MNKEHKQKFGLALGSGGLRGLAHIGVIKVLLENKIPIDFISGSSAGALVGSYLAVFGEIDSLEKYVLKNSKDFLPMFLDFSLSGGFISGKKIDIFLEKILNGSEFSQTKIPFYVAATDLISGNSIIYSSGKLAPAVRGSMSIPLVFKPVSYQDKLLVDGGLSEPVPVKILKKMGADKVLAVNLYHQNEFNHKEFSISDVALRTTIIALHNLAEISVRDADLVLNPDASACINEIKITDYFDVENIKKIIAIGEEEARRHLPEIKKLFKNN